MYSPTGQNEPKRCFVIFLGVELNVNRKFTRNYWSDDNCIYLRTNWPWRRNAICPIASLRFRMANRWETSRSIFIAHRSG